MGTWIFSEKASAEPRTPASPKEPRPHNTPASSTPRPLPFNSDSRISLAKRASRYLGRMVAFSGLCDRDDDYRGGSSLTRASPSFWPLPFGFDIARTSSVRKRPYTRNRIAETHFGSRYRRSSATWRSCIPSPPLLRDPRCLSPQPRPRRSSQRRGPPPTQRIRCRRSAASPFPRVGCTGDSSCSTRGGPTARASRGWSKARRHDTRTRRYASSAMFEKNASPPVVDAVPRRKHSGGESEQ